MPVNPRRAGVEARPYEVWGGVRDAAISQPTQGGEVGTRNTTPSADQCRVGAEMGWRVAPALSVNQRRRTGDGAPYGV